MDNKSHEFRVSIWEPGNGQRGSFFEDGYWKEMARCIGPRRAAEVADCLSLRHPQGVQIAQIDEQGKGFSQIKYIPEAAQNLKSRLSERMGRDDQCL